MEAPELIMNEWVSMGTSYLRIPFGELGRLSAYPTPEGDGIIYIAICSSRPNGIR